MSSTRLATLPSWACAGAAAAATTRTAATRPSPLMVGGSWVRLRRDDELDAAVLRAPLLGAVVGDRHGLAVALGLHPVGRDVPADEVGADALGALLGQVHVVGVAAAAVGVALDAHLDRRVVL